MNAKQRKIAERIRERALLDSDTKLQKVEALYRQLAAERAEFDKMKSAYLDQFAKDSFELIQKKRNLHDEWVATTGRVAEINMIREVLLQLELDEDPTQIALNIRKQFGLMIPEW